MRRREVRKMLAMLAQCRTVGERVEVTVSDISCRGCRIAPGALSLAVGKVVVLRPAGMESITGIVRWCSEKGIGVEFDYPLHPAVVDHLCSLYPDEVTPISMGFAA